MLRKRVLSVYFICENAWFRQLFWSGMVLDWRQLFLVQNILSLRYDPSPRVLILVFLFFNLLVLPTLYITLFFIVRFHSKSMKEWNSIHNKSSPLPSERDSIALCDHSKSTFQFAPAQEEACSRQITTADSRGKESAYKRINHVSKTLLLYPIAYLCCSMPITTARIAQFTGAPVPIPVVFFAAGIYGATGFVNVVLYTVTRKGIVSFDWLRRWRKGS